MSSSLSATIRRRRLREFLSPRGTQGEGQSCHWSEETIRARTNRSDLVAEINDVLAGLLNDEESSGKVNCIEVPDCVHKRTPCDLHHAALFDFVRECGPETFQIHQRQLLLLDGDQDWNSSEAETDSDLDSNHEELHSSGKENRNPGDDEDDIKHEDDDDDDDDGIPRSIEPSLVEEDDKKEIIRKDEASERCLQFIKVNDDHERWLVPISNDDEPAASTDELHQCEPVTQPFRTPSRATSDRARGPSAGSKDDPSLLQLVYQIDSAKKDFLKQCYKENPSYRTLIAWITLSIDPSCFQDVKINEEVVRQRITAPFISEASDPSLAKEGYVYAFRDNDFQLIKIGSTMSLEKRKAEIERKCGFVNGLTLVAAAKVKAYKRVEDIIHQDLAPHRRFFNCACGQSTTKKGFTRHQEYFQIDDAAAVSTLQLWVDFVQEQPWEQDPWTGRFGRNISLRKEWRDKLLKPSGVKSHESHEDHDERIKRWRDFLNIRTFKAAIIKGASTSFVTSGSTMDQERAVAAATRDLSPAGTPSKPPRSPVDDVPVVERSTKPSTITSGPLKTSPLSKAEKVEHMQEQETCSTAPLFTFGLPHRSKNKGSTPDDPIVIDDISTKVKRRRIARIVHSAEIKPPSVLQNIAGKQPYAADRFQIFSDMTPSKGTDPMSSPERVVTPGAQECPAGRGLFAHHQFDTIWSPPASNHPTSPTQASRTIKPEQFANDELLSAPIQHSKTPQQDKSGEQPRTDSNQEETTPSQMQSSRGHATTNAIVASPLAKSIIDLATNLLAREVRPLPARTVSTDLRQLRWPLACSIVFALQSPHIPSVLSLFMWSIFLPFFVAELRGWSV